jgi:DNA-binding FadR family transcriptional regulator
MSMDTSDDSRGSEFTDMTTSPMSQTDVVISRVKQMLSSGQLGPGGRLPIEKDLAASLEVSRGSLREGIRALSTMGILETRQGAGTFVTQLEPAELLSAMEFWVSLQEGKQAGEVHAVRRSLETEAAGAAARRISQEELERAESILGVADAAISSHPTEHETALKADIEFHRLIAEASGNPVLSALIEALSGRTIRGRMWRSTHDKAGLRDSHREHLEILHALQSRDPERARVRMASHLYAVEDYVRSIPAGALAESDGADGVDGQQNGGDGPAHGDGRDTSDI